MADRFVVPAGGMSNSTATWSATSGGAGGASVPTTADSVFLDALSGQLTTTPGFSFANFDCTGYTGTLTTTSTLTLGGAGTTFRLVVGMTVVVGTGDIVINSTAPNVNIYWGGHTAFDDLTLNSPTTLQSTLTLGGAGSILACNNTGSLTSNGFNITTGSFALSTGGTLSPNLAGSTITLTGSQSFLPAFSIPAVHSLVSPANIIVTGDSLTTFNATIFAPGKTLPKVTMNATALDGFPPALGLDVGTITELAFTGAVTTPLRVILFNNLTLGVCTFPTFAVLTSSSEATPRILTSNTTTFIFNQMIVESITAAGTAAPFYAPNSIDAGGTTNILFRAPFTHKVTGITLDAAGAVLVSCDVSLMKYSTKEIVDTGVSDAVTGAYTLFAPDNDPQYAVVAYRADAPTVSDVTGSFALTPVII